MHIFLQKEKRIIWVKHCRRNNKMLAVVVSGGILVTMIFFSLYLYLLVFKRTMNVGFV